MFIELNAFWTHGWQWFDESSISANLRFSCWIDKSISDNDDFYKKAIHNWTIYDVLKRQCACENKLNYIVGNKVNF